MAAEGFFNLRSSAAQRCDPPPFWGRRRNHAGDQYAAGLYQAALPRSTARIGA